MWLKKEINNIAVEVEEEVGDGQMIVWFWLKKWKDDIEIVQSLMVILLFLGPLRINLVV